MQTRYLSRALRCGCFSSAWRSVEKYSNNLKIPLDKSASCAIIQKLSDSATEHGGIAQLGERLNGIQEVSGSIPLISTKKLRNLRISKLFSCFYGL